MFTFREYLSYAERYLSDAEQHYRNGGNVDWLLMPATILAWSSIEAFINNMLDDFGALPDGIFDLHERAFLLEKRIRFEDRGEQIGQFLLEGVEYRRLEDKILFLVAKFGDRRARNLKGETLWQNFQQFKDVRDALVHPRRDKEFELDTVRVRGFIQTAKDVIHLVGENVWNKKIEF